mgnify:FL=1
MAGALLGGLVIRESGCAGAREVETPVVQYRTKTHTDTVVVEKQSLIERLTPVFTVDTIWLTRALFDTGDSGAEVVAVPVFEAGIDTVMFDSSLTLGVRYTSPLPLDPRGYFTLRAGLKEKTITEKEIVFIPEEKGWLSRWLHFGIVVAPGYGIFENKPDIFVGMGIMVGL